MPVSQRIGDDRQILATDSKQMEQLNLNDKKNDGESESVAETSGTNVSTESSGNTSLEIHTISTYDPSIELISEIKEPFDIKDLEELFEDGIIATSDNVIWPVVGDVLVRVTGNYKTENYDHEFGISGPVLKMKCVITNLSKTAAKDDIEIGIVQFSERSLTQSHEHLTVYHELFSNFLYNRKYVLDRVDSYNRVIHPFYDESCFHKIRKGSIPDEKITLTATDIPQSAIRKVIENYKLDSYERHQRFPVYIVMKCGNEYRVLYSFEWMFHSLWTHNYGRCEIKDTLRYGIIKEEKLFKINGTIKAKKPVKFDEIKSSLDDPICNDHPITYTLDTKTKEIVVDYPKDLNFISKEEFEELAKSRLREIHKGIKGIKFKEIVCNDQQITYTLDTKTEEIVVAYPYNLEISKEDVEELAKSRLKRIFIRIKDISLNEIEDLVCNGHQITYTLDKETERIVVDYPKDLKISKEKFEELAKSRLKQIFIRIKEISFTESEDPENSSN